MENRFTDGIQTEYKDGFYTLLREFTAYLVKDGNKIYITVPKGFKTDFTSTPRILYPILPPTGKHNPAALVHDYLYSIGRFSRKDSDEFFFQLLGVCKVDLTISRLAYCGVRLFGKSHYLEKL